MEHVFRSTSFYDVASLTCAAGDNYANFSKQYDRVHDHENVGLASMNMLHHDDLK